MSTKSIDLTETNINIDAMLDVYVNTQKEMGDDPGLEECELSVDKSGNITRKKQAVEEPQKEDIKQCSHSCGGKCGGSCHSNSDDTTPYYLKNRLGLFEDSMSPELADDENDDETYVCEYCTDVGYKKEYKPHICDTCDTCSTCPEFLDNDCSGCGYSIYRTGNLYSQELAVRGEAIPLDYGEKELIDYVKHPGIVEEENETRELNFDFTVMDFNHKL